MTFDFILVLTHIHLYTLPLFPRRNPLSSLITLPPSIHSSFLHPKFIDQNMASGFVPAGKLSSTMRPDV